MKAFEYAAPRHERDVVRLLHPEQGRSAILAGGTDLIGLLKKFVLAPERVVNIKEVPSLRGIADTSQGLLLGATTRLDELLEAPELQRFPALLTVLGGINSLQIRAQSTLGGELCQRPRCWYFRNGRGLLAQGGVLSAGGDNRYHAILGNAGPAKFVSASRLAPALIALGAQARVLGPGTEEESWLPLEELYQTPRDEAQRELTLAPNQLLTHVRVPFVGGWAAGAYEVRQGAGADAPLAAAAAGLYVSGGIIQQAKVVLGQAAPVPWVSVPAAQVLVGRPADLWAAEVAADAAVAPATPLSDNAYKVRLVRTAVKRAVLSALGLPHGGFA